MLLAFYRKDELARVKAHGARVLTLEQLDGLVVRLGTKSLRVRAKYQGHARPRIAAPRSHQCCQPSVPLLLGCIRNHMQPRASTLPVCIARAALN